MGKCARGFAFAAIISLHTFYAISLDVRIFVELNLLKYRQKSKNNTIKIGKF